jgi:DNA primase
MPIFSEESLHKLRQKIDLIDVLSSHLDLKRTGASFKALCPFHDEKTPSFIVHKGDAHYHCFGCGAHGDAIAFLMSYLKMSFSDAVESLAEKFGVTLEKSEEGPDKKGIQKITLKEALLEAKRFYHFYLLHTEEGYAALDYLYNRGIDLEFIHLFDIGFAPKTPGLFTKFMQDKGFSLEILQQAGLLTIPDKGSPKEFFYARVMFPIKDTLGAFVGFSGRKIHEDTFGPKYVNTPETPLFKKSHLLFGLSDCRKRIAKEKKAIVVEGQIDTLRLIQEGFDMTVAGQGTAFTEEHAQELIKLGVQQIYLAFDGDEAGRQAAIKVGDFFQKEGIEVRVVQFEDKLDPDLILREKGPHLFVQYLDRAIDYIVFLVEQLGKTMDKTTPSGKHQLAEACGKRIRSWHHPLMVHESLRTLAKILDVPEHLVQKNLVQEEIVIKKSETIAHQSIDPQRILEADFLRWLVLFGNLTEIKRISFENITPEDLKVPVCKQLYELYRKAHEEKKECDLLTLGMGLNSVEGQLFLSEILQKRINGEKAKEGCIATIQKILERNWLHERELIKINIHSGRCSEEEVYLLAKRFDELKRQPPTVKGT